MMLSKLIIRHEEKTNTLKVEWQQGGSITYTSEAIRFESTLTPQDRSDLRWYLEEYLRLPYGIHPDRARRVEDQMRQWGGNMFELLFGKSSPARDVYTQIRNSWREYGLEIHYRDAAARNFPWELLYDSEQSTFLVHAFSSFARYQKPPVPPKISLRPATEKLNVLLVIARPSGERDVPYRTVARPIMELLRSPGIGERIHVEVLRPPTFAKFNEALSKRKDDGSSFFDVVHFDGHGSAGLDLEKIALEQRNHFRTSSGEAFKSELVFETIEGKEDKRNAYDIKEVLGQHKVPLILLNACRSGMEALESEQAQLLLLKLSKEEKTTPEELREWLDEAQQQEISSVTGMLLGAGAHGVVGMGYIVYAKAAALFMTGFYRKLLDGGTAAQAVSAGRIEMIQDAKRPTRFGDMELEDWQVPVYHEVVPVHLFQPTMARDFAAEFAALQSAPSSNSKLQNDKALPAPPQFRFLGRDKELLAIERALLRPGVAGVTLIGLGGTGKTALAVGAARWLIETHASCAENVFFHAFLPEDENGNAIHPGLHRLISSIGKTKIHPTFPDIPEAHYRELVISYLRQEPSLIILDNAELMQGLGEEPALLDESQRREWKEFLHEVCAPKGRAHLLLTSRRPEEWLGLNLEMVPVEGLERDAADELAANVARASMGAKFDTKREDEKWDRDLNSLLDVLGGHPLAIQIVLRHLKDRDPAAVLKAFEDGAAWIDQKLETGTSDRERLLAACINYGFSTLSADAQRLLPFLAFWREWVDSSMLARISEYKNAPDRLRGISVDTWNSVLLEAESTGLVTRNGESPLFQLHPLLSWFLRVQLLQATDTTKLEEVFRHFFGKLSMDIYERFHQGKDAETSIHLFTLHRANLLQALFLARNTKELPTIIALFRALYGLLQHSGQATQAMNLLNELNADWKPIGKIDPDTYEGYLWLDIQFKRGNLLRDNRAFSEANLIFEEIRNLMGEVDAGAVLYQLGMVAHQQHEIVNARDLYLKSLDMALDQKNEDQVAMAYHQLGIVDEEQENFVQAEEWGQKSLKINLLRNNEQKIAANYHLLGVIALGKSDFKTAKELCNKSLTISLRLKDVRAEAINLYQLGRIAQIQRDFDDAKKWYNKSLELKLHLKDEVGIAPIYHQLGAIAHEQGEFTDANAWYIKSLEIQRRLFDKSEESSIYIDLGINAATQGRGKIAATYFVSALRVFQELNNDEAIQGMLANLAQLLLRGMITREVMDEVWKHEMGFEMPPEKVELIYIESDEDIPIPTLPEELSLFILQMHEAGLKADVIIGTIEQKLGQSLPQEGREYLLTQIAKLSNEGKEL